MRLIGMLLAVTFALGGLGIARATTGPTPLAGRPHFHVSHAQVAPFLGKFRVSDPTGRNLISGAYVARYNEFGYPEGSLVMYVYGAHGDPVSWVGATYEYHTIKGWMVMDIISPDNQVIFARMNLRRLADGRLSGVLEQLRPPGRAQQITLAPVT